MHEMSLALEIKAICERELAKLPESRLTALGVEVGAFSGVEVETLQFCLEVVMSEGFDGFRCEVVRQPGTAACLSCGLEFQVTQAPFECPRCGALARGVSGGDSLHVSYIEVECE
ncbi:MAG: hydrogenase maturation nickel metallochaperone HypA [Gemmatimonadota bacterium]|nr:MAG: hydrogenase maturation nickel metallochaperone HypA [Gemmatimonadota bacterium]